MHLDTTASPSPLRDLAAAVNRSPNPLLEVIPAVGIFVPHHEATSSYQVIVEPLKAAADTNGKCTVAALQASVDAAIRNGYPLQPIELKNKATNQVRAKIKLEITQPQLRLVRQ